MLSKRLTSLFMRSLKRVPAITIQSWEHFNEVEHDSPEHYEKPDIPRRIVCFWTGDNVMSDSRKRAFDTLQSTSKTEVLLITPESLSSYIIETYPLHPAYQYLSLVHRSDYLRCYFMHHYGGGYSDIKAARHSWVQSFDTFENDDKSWIMGYPEIGEHGVAPVKGICGEDLRKNWYFLLGNCAYICAPYSPFTTSWYDEVHKRLDDILLDLQNCPGNSRGDNDGYPIEWTYLLGNIFHPLCLKYSNHVSYDRTIKPVLGGYL